jgi:hypothetical protein
MDYLSIIAIIISLATAISQLHLRKVHLGCVESECYKSKSVPPTPIFEDKIINTEPIEERFENNLTLYINTNGS